MTPISRMEPDAAGAGLRQLLAGLAAVRGGDLSARLPRVGDPLMDDIASVFNGMAGELAQITSEVTRVAREVGTDGKLGGRAEVSAAGGTWRDLTESVNVMAGNLTGQVRDISRVATAVARGDLSQKITVGVSGELLELKETINTMVGQLSGFAGEVTRVAREVGTEGNLGGQAIVPNQAGTWQDLTDNVNSMANNLTSQVRNIADVTTAVARGDLSKKIDVDARGEILELKGTINTMVDQLSAFAAEVTRVAREVGRHGQLGGQAEVEGVSGTWRRLTENVNELAGNLTRQVRAIAEVTSAVAAGDLTRAISVEAQGEVAELKDNINAMVRSLRETTKANAEHDWLQTNLVRISRLMQGHRDLATVADMIMTEFVPLLGAQHGTFFVAEGPGGAGGDGGAAGSRLTLVAGYGLRAEVDSPRQFRLGESLIGQVAKTRKPTVIDEAPAGYLKISSSLGDAAPASVMVLPIVFEGQVLGVIEVSSFTPFTRLQQDFAGQLMETIGVNVSTIMANSRTDALLAESQRLTAELQRRSAELQTRREALESSNADLQEKATQLAIQNRDIELKNAELEHARQEIEERARQLDAASRYKSQFLANMSHELRTPLNSLLILARLLAQNPTRNLTDKQVEYANVIHSSGSDLLQLINDILDLSRVEAGKMDVHPEPFALSELLTGLRVVFEPLIAEKGLEFVVEQSPQAPGDIYADKQRLRQILRNFLSNAIKFTERGRVTLRVEAAGEVPGAGGQRVIAFSVTDTGIGISEEQLSTIFDAFEQGDATASRRYGGTGLGLAISKEVALALGGWITADSTQGAGSTFTLYLPAASGAPGTPAPAPARAAQATGREPVSPAGPAAPPQAAAAPAASGHERLRGRTVLIIDDDVRNVFAITSILELYGMTVLHAPDGRRGIGMIRSRSDIALVLMDLMMPEMDGYATTAAIRALPQFASLPVIAVTARAMPGARDEIIAAGASDYLTKPVDLEELLATMERWLQDGRPAA